MSEPNSAFEGLVDRYRIQAAINEQPYPSPYTQREEELARKNILDAYAGVVAERDEQRQRWIVACSEIAALNGRTIKLESDLAATRAETTETVVEREQRIEELKGEIERITNERDAAEEALAELRAKEGDLAAAKAEIDRMKPHYFPPNTDPKRWDDDGPEPIV
jgi:chromosome segregation ATPase